MHSVKWKGSNTTELYGYKLPDHDTAQACLLAVSTKQSCSCPCFSLFLFIGLQMDDNKIKICSMLPLEFQSVSWIIVPCVGSALERECDSISSCKLLMTFYRTYWDRHMSLPGWSFLVWISQMANTQMGLQCSHEIMESLLSGMSLCPYTLQVKT